MDRSKAWVPSLKYDKIVPHRIDICESANMAHVVPPALTYRLRDESCHAHGVLSTFQYETVGRVCQALLTHGAFLLGDATGTGKTRVLGAVAAELVGYRVLWLSVNRRLLAEVNVEMRAIDAPELTCASTKLSGDSHVFDSYAGILQDATFHVLRRWLASGPSLLILDEAHVCRNDTTTSRRVDALLSVATRVIFCTATVASSLRHLKYLQRLGLWGPDAAFKTCPELVAAMRVNSISAMEVLSLQMKKEGRSLSRQISFEGVEVRIETLALSRQQRALYDSFVGRLGEQSASPIARSQFFLLLLLQFKVASAIEIAQDALQQGFAPIISLQSTGEASQRRGHTALSDMLIRCGLRADDVPAEDPIDQLIAGLGGGDNVAEISGRSLRPHRGRMSKVPPTADEVFAFQAGRKRAAILTRAGSTGISLHDETGRRRCNIVVQLPWSAEEFLQQAGRCHRTNQMTPPTYVILNTDVPGENRLSQVVAARLSSLGALTQGERLTRISCVRQATRVDWSPTLRRTAVMELFARVYIVHSRVHGTPPTQQLIDQLPRRMASRDKFLVEAIDAALSSRKDDDGCACDDVARLLLATTPTLRAMHRPWSRCTHMTFPLQTRSLVEATLMCAARAETSCTIGALPHTLVDKILEEVAREPWVGADQSEEILRELMKSRRGEPPTASGASSFTNSGVDAALNRVLAMRVGTQRGLMNLIEHQNVTSDVEVAIVPFSQLVSRAHMRTQVTCVRRACVRAGTCQLDGVAVDVIATAVSVMAPPATAIAKRDVMTQQIVAVVLPTSPQEDVLVQLPGKAARRVNATQWRFMHGDIRFRETVDMSEWDKLHRRRVGVDCARATRASRTYIFVTDDMLAAWPASKRRVVALPDDWGVGLWWA